jgi:hypothetical protein
VRGQWQEEVAFVVSQPSPLKSYKRERATCFTDSTADARIL